MYFISSTQSTSIGALMVLVGIATFTSGLVMLVRANRRRVLDISPKPPPPGTDHYEVVDEGEKSTPLGAGGVYEEVDKQDTKGHTTNHYQELDPMNVKGSEYASIKS